MQLTKVMVPTIILGAGFLVCTSSVYGTSEYAKKEKKSCTYCHSNIVSSKEQMAGNLNMTGTCYKENEHSLANCSVAK